MSSIIFENYEKMRLTVLLLSDHGPLKGLNSRSLHFQCADYVLKEKACITQT